MSPNQESIKKLLDLAVDTKQKAALGRDKALQEVGGNQQAAATYLLVEFLAGAVELFAETGIEEL